MTPGAHGALRAAVATIALLSATAAGAQMKFLDPGQSGFSARAGALAGDNSLGFSAGLNGTVAGRVDLDLAAYRLFLDEFYRYDDATLTAVAPSVSVQLIGSAEATAGAEISASYEMGSYASDWLLTHGTELSTTSLTALLSIYGCTRASPTLLVFPELAIGYRDGTGTYAGGSLNGRELDQSGVVFEVGASLLFNDRLWVAPAMRLVDGEAVWSTEFGYLVSGR